MFHDKMTSKERMKAYVEGKEVDRLPCFPLLGESGASLFDVKLSEYYWDPKKLSHVEIETFKMFQGDGVDISTGLKGIGEALGAKVAYPQDNLCMLTEPSIKDYSDIDGLDVINPYKDGRLPILLNAMELTLEAVDDEANVSAGIAGPMSVAASIIGTERLMKDIRRNPEGVWKVLDLSVQSNLAYVEVVHREFGIPIGIGDPVASMSLMSKATFHKYALPFLSELVDGIIRITGKKPSLHICGKTKAIWEYLPLLNISSFSVDNVEDLSELREAIGDRLMIIGNIKPVETLYQGTKEEVIAESKRCIDIAIDSPNGYALAPGCQIPVGTNPENIIAMLDTARTYGKNAKIGKKASA